MKAVIDVASRMIFLGFMSSRGNVGVFRDDFETVSDRRPHLGAGEVAE